MKWAELRIPDELGQRDRFAIDATNRVYHPRWYERRAFGVACYLALFVASVIIALSLFT